MKKALQYAILGMLNYQPMTGYALKKSMDRSIAHFWSATQSHIYKELEALEQRGWLSHEIILQEERPNRKEYAISAAGRKEFQHWLGSSFPLNPLREGWLIQMFFAHQLEVKALIGLLQERRKAVKEELENLEEAKLEIEERKAAGGEGVRRAATSWALTLDYGYHHYRSDLDWLDQQIASLQSGA